ncbi:MAG TPA: O-antigen ligase family protein [Longimicrobiales bacterium]|nr:O-antigen ligase family protein [Longimicrobiales bacterium]
MSHAAPRSAPGPAGGPDGNLAARRSARGAPWDADGLLALGACTALAAGVTLALAGSASDSTPLAVTGGILALAGAVVLVAAGLVGGTLLLALAAPLPAVYDSGDVRVAAVAPVAAGVLLAWALRRGADRTPIRTGALPRRALAALLLAVLVAAAFAADVPLSARETLNFALMLGLLVAATDELARDRAAAARLVDALVAGAGVCGALAVLEMVRVLPGDFPRWGTPFNRAALGFGQPNGLGFFLAVALPLALQRLGASRGLGRLASGAAALATALGLLATFSRASWVAAALGVTALALAGEGRRALRLLAGAAVAAVIVDVASGGLLRDTVRRTIGDWVVEQRAALFLAAVRMFVEHPFTGVGPGGFADQVEQYGAQVPRLWDIQATPHNAYIQMAAEGGILGVLTFVAFLAISVRTFVRAAREPGVDAATRDVRLALLWSLATACIAAGGIWPFAHGTGEVLVLVLGLGFAETTAGALSGSAVVGTGGGEGAGAGAGTAEAA